MTFSALFRANRVFFITYLLVILSVGTLMLLYTKEQLIRFINDHNSPIGDLLFPYLTYLGDGGFVIVIGVFMLVLNRRAGWLILASFAISGLISLFLKMIVFPERLRPVRYFEHSNWEYHLIKDLHINEYNSFPSGHTTSAFALFSMLAFLWQRKAWGWLGTLLAAIAGYSRVYLFQHFVEDAFVGAILGTITSVITVLYYRKRFGDLPALGKDS
ncbi:phosphatase PAP2 family protein [Fibrella forsythiae]|uniref:Phosphatase PAP2 family protein n=1 Tax=Fibrella forsythiae TaxID=2817061 RepID=A0ABS3JMZ2_9BACT|nr:phosphatase PAP2 family protein [Fibrella forsythiae]MBO0950564.1 phosphatase PAP2 family protein [Fibrella forsythiae]